MGVLGTLSCLCLFLSGPSPLTLLPDHHEVRNFPLPYSSAMIFLPCVCQVFCLRNGKLTQIYVIAIPKRFHWVTESDVFCHPDCPWWFFHLGGYWGED